MALVNIDTALGDAIRLITKAPQGGGVEIMSYKRNRTVALVRLAGERVLLRERGYVDDEDEVNFDQLQKRLKNVFKREFPRSRKVRFNKFSDPAELERLHQKI